MFIYFVRRRKKMVLASIIVAVRNEEQHLQECIESLLAQSFQDFELLIIDGMSDDKTPEIIASFTKRYPQKIRSFTNPARKVAQGRNIGFANATGKYIGFIDGHSYADKQWLATLVDSLKQAAAQVGAVGSVHYNADNKPFSTATTLVLSSSIGGGGTSYKPGKKLRAVATSYACLYKKEVLDAIKQNKNYYNPYFVKGQDAEMNLRIRKKGYIILQHPKAITYYYKRPHLQGFWNQMVNAGFWRYKIVKKHPDTVLENSLLFGPLAFFIGVSTGLLFSVTRLLSAYALFFYIAVVAIYTLQHIIRTRKLYNSITFLLYLCVHVGYSYGLLKSMFSGTIKIQDRVKQ
jgi:glycosyltransferase involved in cell wall biosynthesis